jgi:hypothetical protein
VQGVRRSDAPNEVNLILRQAARERGHRNRSFDLPADALFGRRR